MEAERDMRVDRQVVHCLEAAQEGECGLTLLSPPEYSMKYIDAVEPLATCFPEVFGFINLFRVCGAKLLIFLEATEPVEILLALLILGLSEHLFQVLLIVGGTLEFRVGELLEETHHEVGGGTGGKGGALGYGLFFLSVFQLHHFSSWWAFEHARSVLKVPRTHLSYHLRGFSTLILHLNFVLLQLANVWV